MSQCAKRGSLGRAINVGAPDDAAFTRSACIATNLKSTFNYHSVFDATAKIDFAVSVLTRRQTDSEWLLRPQRHEKLDYSYESKVRIFAPLGQSCDDFIEDHDARHDRSAREMPGQAGMISADRAANFKVQAAKFHPCHQIQQLGDQSTEHAVCSSVSEPTSRPPLLLQSERLEAFTRFANNVRRGESELFAIGRKRSGGFRWVKSKLR